MKYNKQLFDQIEVEYNNLISLSEFIYDQMLEHNDDNNRYEILSELDIYIQAILAKVVIDNGPKNPALFNILKKLSKYANFYQGINLDDWFKEKDKVLKNINNKINQSIVNVPTMINIANQIDKKSNTTELAYQMLESMISLVIIIVPEHETFDDVEKEILEKYYQNIYELIQKD